MTAVDSDESPAALAQYRSEPAAKFVTMNFASDALPASDFVALSPGVPRASPAVRAIGAGVPVLVISNCSREVARRCPCIRRHWIEREDDDGAGR